MINFRIKRIKQIFRGLIQIKRQSDPDDRRYPRGVIHIPKTAGTSLRAAMEREYSGDMLYDYGPKSRLTHRYIRRYIHNSVPDLPEAKQRIATMLDPVIIGHFHISRYIGILDVQNCATLVRDPFERVVSHYKHAVLRQGHTGDFGSFIDKPANRNLQSRYLDHVPVQAIGAIGTTEKYQEFIRLINHKWQLHLPVLSKNTILQRQANRFGDIDFNSYRHDILTSNSRDARLFKEVNHLFNNSLIFLDRNIPEARAFCIVEENQQWLNGWGFRFGTDAPLTLVIRVDGVVDQEVVCTESNEHLNSLGVPRNGFVGFRVQLKQPVARKIELLDPESGLMLFERVIKSECSEG